MVVENKKTPGLGFIGDGEPFDEEDLEKQALALIELANFPWANAEEFGTQIPKYNNAVRINIVSEKRSKVVRNPSKFLLFLKYAQRIGPVGGGLKVNIGSSPSYIHAVLETPTPVALWFYDYKKALGTDKLIQAVNLMKATNISSGVIITNIIAIHARDFAERERQEGQSSIYVYRFDDILNELGIRRK